MSHGAFQGQRTRFARDFGLFLPKREFPHRHFSAFRGTAACCIETVVLDGGTLGMDLLYYLEGVENLLLIDAVEARREAGALIRLSGEEVPAFLSLKVSPHQLGVPDMLAAAKLKGSFPKNIVLWGVQPASLEIGMELSETVAPLVDVAVENIVRELRNWGISM